jgi:hypothetical protein
MTCINLGKSNIHKENPSVDMMSHGKDKSSVSRNNLVLDDCCGVTYPTDQ